MKVSHRKTTKAIFLIKLGPRDPKMVCQMAWCRIFGCALKRKENDERTQALFLSHIGSLYM